MLMCDNEANEYEKSSSTYANEGEEKTSSMSEKKETVNARQKEPVKARFGSISIHECR